MSIRSRSDEDVRAEIDAHIAIEADRLIADGMNPDEARIVARRRFGNITHTTEHFHQTRRFAWLDTLAQDLSYAVRSFRRQPAFAATVVFTMSLALAANASLFAVFDGLLFRPLPYQDPDRIVHRADLTAPPYLRLEILNEIQATPLLSDAAGASVNRAAFQQNTEAVVALGMQSTFVTPNLFTFLDVKPFLGRLVTDDDLDASGNSHAVMIGFDLWKSQFGGDPSVIGTEIVLPGQQSVSPYPRLLVGILPSSFDFPEGTNVWVPRAAYNVRQPINSYPQNYLRLAPGATIDQLRAAFPRFTFTPLREHVQPRGATALAILLAATGLLMLVAWVQVASLLLARSAGRATEVGVRLALGASRWRLARQFGTEAIVIAAAALALGWAFTPGFVQVIVWLLPPEVTNGQTVVLDRRTLAFAGALSAVGVLVIGLAPLEILRRSSPLALLRGSLFGSVRVSAVRLRTSLVITQLGMTTCLLYMAGLALHSFERVTAVDMGFQPEGTLAVRLPFTASPTETTPPAFREYLAGQQARFAEMLPSLRAIPGVVAAGGGRVPLVPSLFGGGSDRPIPVTPMSGLSSEPIDVKVSRITRGYPEAIGLRLREGHLPDATEFSSSMLVNDILARQLVVFGPVLGQRLNTGSGTYTIVGIFDALVTSRPDEPSVPEGFTFWTDAFYSSVIPTILVKTRRPSDERQVTESIRATLQRVFPYEPARRVIRLEDEARRATGEHRARSTVLGLIALLCLPLSMAGVGGALLHSVRQQSREIGIRLALGATPGDVRRRIVGQALGCVTIGLVIGLAGGLGAGRWMSQYLFGVQAADPWSIAAVVLALVAVAFVSALWPARRASTIDPSVVLRDA